MDPRQPSCAARVEDTRQRHASAGRQGKKEKGKNSWLALLRCASDFVPINDPTSLRYAGQALFIAIFCPILCLFIDRDFIFLLDIVGLLQVF
jgi:hypothetical protein